MGWRTGAKQSLQNCLCAPHDWRAALGGVGAYKPQAFALPSPAWQPSHAQHTTTGFADIA
jgi:hypothetical protein